MTRISDQEMLKSDSDHESESPELPRTHSLGQTYVSAYEFSQQEMLKSESSHHSESPELPTIH